MEGRIRGIIALLVLVAGLRPVLAAASPSAIDIEALGYPRLDLFDSGDGLPNLTIVSVSATEDGHIWAGTMRGLARFNGLRFVPVALPGDDGHPDVISSVLALDNRQVWVAPLNRGVYLWNGTVWRHFRPGRDFPGYDVRRLRAFNTRDGMRVFATTNEGIIAVWDGKRWTELPVKYKLRGGEIFDVLYLPGHHVDEDVLWIGSYESGLIRCIGRAVCEQLPIPGEPRAFEISSLRALREADGSSSLWIGSYGGGVARYHDGRWQRFRAEDGDLTSNFVHDIEIIADKGRSPEVWVGSRNGFSSYRDGRWQRFEDQSNLRAIRVWSLAKGRDDDGRPQLWAGTDNGATRVHVRGDLRTVRRLSEDSNGVWAVRFETDPDGTERLWLGSDGEGLWRYQNGAWSQYGRAEGLPGDIVRSISRHSDGTLWVGMWNGEIAVMQNGRFRTLETPWDKGDQQAVTAFLPDQRGGMWVGLRKNGVAYHDGDRWRWFDVKGSGAPDFVLGLVNTGSDDDPVIWASSKGDGLGRFQRGQWRRFTTWNSELPDNELSTVNVYPDAQGRPVLWIGSRNKGLLRVDVSNPAQPLLVRTPALPVPPHPYVYGAVRNARGDMAVCTDYGAAYWRNDGKGGFRAVDYHRVNGLPHDECNAGALSFDSRGRAWVGTIGGAAVLTPDSTRSGRAKLGLERLRIDHVEYPVHAGALEFVAPGPNAGIDMEFALLTGDREAESQYRTQIIGLEPAPGPWLQSNQRSFTSVPSGDYRLRIEARDYSGHAVPPLELRLRVPTPWWRTGWVLFAIGLGVVYLIWLVMGWRERLLRRRESELRKLVGIRTGELELRGRELRRMNDELTRLSYHDPLTDVANRRKLLEQLDACWLDAQIDGRPIAFILLDADDFKAVNDIYGHLRGDECLQMIARCLTSVIADTPYTLGRYGGEEFGVVLPDCNEERAIALAERCRNAVERLKLAHTGSAVGYVTVSLGVACMQPNPASSSDVLVAKADGALYVAKRQGKNRVVSAGTGD